MTNRRPRPLKRPRPNNDSVKRRFGNKAIQPSIAGTKSRPSGGSFVYYRPMPVRLAKPNRMIEMPLSRYFRESAASGRGKMGVAVIAEK